MWSLQLISYGCILCFTYSWLYCFLIILGQWACTTNSTWFFRYSIKDSKNIEIIFIQHFSNYVVFICVAVPDSRTVIIFFFSHISIREMILQQSLRECSLLAFRNAVTVQSTVTLNIRRKIIQREIPLTIRMKTIQMFLWLSGRKLFQSRRHCITINIMVAWETVWVHIMIIKFALREWSGLDIESRSFHFFGCAFSFSVLFCFFFCKCQSLKLCNLNGELSECAISVIIRENGNFYFSYDFTLQRELSASAFLQFQRNVPHWKR